MQTATFDRDDVQARTRDVTGGRNLSEQDGIGESIGQIVEDAKGYAAAQAALYKAIALARWRVAQGGLIFGAVAAVLALAALIALLVGLILSLSTLIGPLGATAVVVIATLALAGVLGWLAAGRLSRAFGALE